MYDKAVTKGFLYTDFYQLTMAQVYYLKGVHEVPAQFEYFFREYPDYGSHKTAFCVNAGLEWLIEWMKESSITDEDIAFLKDHRGKTGKPLFSDDFLKWLRENGDFTAITMKAIPEGRVIHPQIPIVTVQGPLAMAQMLESSLLNHLNYQVLIATRAARIRNSAGSGAVIDFGMRRAQHTGANAGARAALIGGADFSSNTGISYNLGFQPKGTHAHSMVQAFMTMEGEELNAFRAYAEVYPDNCLLLVDTVNTLESGVPNAIRVFEELRKKGHEPAGIRLDSGDLAHLSIQASKMLDKAGFNATPIVLSNDLDELVIWQIKSQISNEARRYGVDPDRLINRLVYGVGTRLITSKGDAALDGIYKLSALRIKGEWEPSIKLSESPSKIINPGVKKIWRIYDERGLANADVLALEDEEPPNQETLTLHHPTDRGSNRCVEVKKLSRMEELSESIIEEGEIVYSFPSIHEIRKKRESDMEYLDPGVRRVINPHLYHVSLTEKLFRMKENLIKSKLKKNT